MYATWDKCAISKQNLVNNFEIFQIIHVVQTIELFS